MLKIGLPYQRTYYNLPMLKLFLIIFFSFNFFILIPTQAALINGGGGGTTPPGPPPCIPCYTTYYQCIGACRGALQAKTCERCCGGGCGPWQTIQTCNAWSMCKASPSPGCFCEGECLKAPENPTHHNNLSDLTKLADPQNILLPVKLNWDDVAGWQKADGPKSYALTINRIKRHDFIGEDFQKVNINPIENVISLKALNQSDYNVLAGQGACFLESGAEYNWQIQACCNLDGTNCGPSSNWQFSTNLAPEIKTPIDPDWLGKERKEKEPLSTNLSWCESNFRQQWRTRSLSYKLNIYKIQNEREVCHPTLLTGGRCEPLIIRERPNRYPNTEFSNVEHNFFTKDNIYAWQVAACRDRAAIECTDFSQKWSFQIEDTLTPPRLLIPPNNQTAPVGLPILLQWTTPLGAHSFIYHIYQNNNRIIHGIIASPNVVLDHPQLSLDTIYTWRILPCWDSNGEKCQDNAWSEIRYFRTTGRPPELNTKKPTGQNIAIPTVFGWEDVPGAKSYIFRILRDASEVKSTATTESKIILEFPTLLQNTTYSWQVKTCARLGGELCGQWSSPQNFTTFKLTAPTNLVPGENTTIFVGDHHNFSWELKAPYYQFNLIYQRVEREEREQCFWLAETGITKTIPQNSLFLPLECRGNYQWKVRGCLDQKCTERIDGSAGEWSNLQEIILAARIAPEELRAGLVPCGRMFDDPNTKWDETDRCELKHSFILLYLIFNFFLWVAIPMILIGLVAYSGAIFYLSMASGETDPLSQVKNLWRAAGIGLVIIFLAWTIISWTLTIFGYQVGIFGPWWQF